MDTKNFRNESNMIDNNQYINDKVYLKRDIKSHKIFEDHPNLIFGIIIFLWSILSVASLFLTNMFLFWIILLSVFPIAIWYIKNNEKTNWTKSSAFVERDGVIYYIQLGYTLDYQQAGVLPEFKDVEIAGENMKKAKHIQDIRTRKSTYSNALTHILNSNTLASDVVKFCVMCDCRLEKETEQWVWLSYYNSHTNNQRVTQKFRNVYEFSFVKDSK